MRTLRHLAWVALLLLPIAAVSQDARPTVAVLPFNYVSMARGTDSKALGAAFADMIMTELGNRPQIKLLERQQVEDLLTKQKLMVSGRVSDEDALRAGQLLGAQYVVTGSVVLAGGDVRMDIRIVDVETGALPKPPFKEQGKQDKLLTLVEQLADNFTRDLKLPNRAVLAAESVVPAAASLAFSRGLDFEKRGKKEQAAKMFEKTLELAPNHQDARAALGRVRKSGGDT